jgi:tetratricopeptide (TPR) repeat protein
MPGDEAARRELLAAISVQPDSYDALYELGQALFSLRRYLASAKWFDRASAVRRDDWHAWFHAGEAYIHAGRDLEGIARLKEAIALSPDELLPRRLATEACARQGLLDDARTYARWLASHETAPDDKKWAESQLVLLDMATGRYAGPAWDKASPPGIGPLKLRTNAAFERGQHTPDPKKQVAAYEEAIKADPGMYQAENNLGLALVKRRDFDRAVEHFKRADQLCKAADPNGAPKLDANCNIALCLNRSGEPAAAMEFVDIALGAEPAYVPGLCAKGEVLMALGRTEEALEPLRKCMSIEPEHAEAAKLLGAAYAGAKETILATAMLRYAAWLTPDEEERSLIEADIETLQADSAAAN